MDNWYKKSLRRNLVDMHINDNDPKFLSEFSPTAYADALSLSGVDTAIIYAGSCLGINYFATSNGHRHNSLKGRDIVAENIAACKEKGLNVILYFNIWSRWAYDNHPEWRMRNIEGKGYFVDMGGRYGNCCPSTGYFDYVKRLLGDLVNGYDCQGYWVDMIGWNGNICYCDCCKKRFMEETGHEIPVAIDWDDEIFKLFARKREEWFAKMAAGLTEIVKRKDPALTISLQCASWPLGWLGGCTKEFFHCSDYLAGDFYSGGAVQSVTVKYLSNMTKNRPLEYMVSRCSGLEEHTLNKPDHELIAERYAALAGNAAFVFIDAIDPVGTTDERVYRKMGEIFAESEKFEKYIDVDAQLLADVGLILSQSALFNLEDSGKEILKASLPIKTLENVHAAAGALIGANISFDVMDLSSPEKLKGKKVLLLCDYPSIGEAEAQILRDYVRGGGKIYASCRTSLSGGKFLLADVFGADSAGFEPHQYNYVAPIAQNEELLCGFSAKYPLSVNGVFTKICATGQCETMALVSHCYFGKPNDPYLFASAISNPPDAPTDSPALVRNRYGEGMCVYSCGTIEANKNANAQKAFASLIASLIDRPTIVCDAPWQIEVQAFRSGKKISVNLNSCITPFPPTPVHGINVALYIGDEAVESVTDVGAGKEIGYEIDGGYLKMQVSEVTYFNSLQILLK